MTQTEATELIKSFVSQNPTVTGVKNSADLKLTLSYSDTGFWDNATYWNVRSANQFIDTIEVLNTQIMFEINIPGPVYYIINVDVMTGEIISEQPTIIS